MLIKELYRLGIALFSFIKLNGINIDIYLKNPKLNHKDNYIKIVKIIKKLSRSSIFMHSFNAAEMISY